MEHATRTENKQNVRAHYLIVLGKNILLRAISNYTLYLQIVSSSYKNSKIF